MKLRNAACSLSLLFGATACTQQVPDRDFNYHSRTPAYPKGQGPVVVLDEAHSNFHTLKERYYAFGQVMTNDGYVMRSGSEKFTADHLREIHILVIANALADDDDWSLPTRPAFTKEEVEAVKTWVHEGGNLFLIADHMPFGGAVAGLGSAFGINWVNGYALLREKGPEIFSRRAGNLSANVITDGGGPDERIDSIMCFTGSGFLLPLEATAITTLGSAYTMLLPEEAGAFTDTTASVDGRDHANLAMLLFGKGRVVVSGEAAMFSAQLQGAQRLPMGMNEKGAEQDPQFLLNVIHWLDRRL